MDLINLVTLLKEQLEHLQQDRTELEQDYESDDCEDQHQVLEDMSYIDGRIDQITDMIDMLQA